MQKSSSAGKEKAAMRATQPDALYKFLDENPNLATLREARQMTRSSQLGKTIPLQKSLTMVKTRSLSLEPEAEGSAGRFTTSVAPTLHKEEPPIPEQIKPDPSVLSTLNLDAGPTRTQLLTETAKQSQPCTRFPDRPDNQGKGEGGGKEAVVYYKLEEPHFALNTVSDCTVKPVPVNVSKDLLNGDKYLLTPAERRQLAQMELANQTLQRQIIKEQRDRQRTQSLTRLRYPNGVPGVDSPANQDSPVYRSEASNRAEMMATRQATTQQRMTVLTTHGGSIGSDLLPQTMEPKGFQAKVPAQGCPAAMQDTHSRLFGDETPVGGTRLLASVPRSDVREGRLRDQDTRGRTYNIISGHELSVQPSQPNWGTKEIRIHPSLFN